MLPLTTFIHRKLVVLEQRTTLLHASRALCDNQIGCLLVGDGEGGAVGIVTDRDLVCRGLIDNKGPDTPLKEIMSSELVTAPDDGSLLDVTQLMERHGFRRIPIVHKQGNGKAKFCGIVTLDDLIVSNQLDPSTISRIIQRQVGRRMAHLEDLKTEASQRSLLRSEGYRINTLHRFYAHFSKFMSVDRDLLPPLTQFILSFLLQRVTFTGASHFIAQLPRLIQEPLRRLPPGPDRNFSGDRLILELSKQFHFNEQESRSAFSRFLLALNEWVGVDALDKLAAQLPQEYLPYFEFATHEARQTQGQLKQPSRERGQEHSREHGKEQGREQTRQPIKESPHSNPAWVAPICFEDRAQAAELIARELSQYRDKNPLILGIPRGSVPMAEILANKLKGDLDVVLVHKIGAPENPEFAIGSVSEFGSVHQSEAASLLEIPPKYAQEAAHREIARLRDRRQLLTPIRPPIDPKDRTVIIIDDGIATGSTMLAAVHAIRSQNPRRIVVAAPVASPTAVRLLEKQADELVILQAPEAFFSVGQFYENFSEVNDEDILQILSKVGAGKKEGAAAHPRKKTA